MNDSTMKKNIPFLLIAVCALAVFACLLLYTYDNKYTANGPQAYEGVLVVDEATLTEHPALFLVEGWEYYSGRLLTPEDFMDAPPVADAYIYIGQFGGFDSGNWSASPHGSASYRLRIKIPDEQRAYLLEVPEIFSAYRLYVNGKEVATMGDIDPQHYVPETGNQMVGIEAGGEIEIIVAVSDFSHLYSGMVYPPVFGQPQAVAALLDTRLVLRSLFMAVALVIGALSVITGFLSRRGTLGILYGLLCLCFVGFTTYPILRTLSSGGPWLYAVEMAAFCAMLTVVMLLQRILSDSRNRWEYWFIGFGFGMCIFSVLLPLILPGGNLQVMTAYSVLVSAYELVTAAFITLTAIRALLKGRPYSIALLCGFLVFDVALVMDRVLPLYEPIATGWFYEMASFVLILCMGGAVGMEVASKYRENTVLTERQLGMEQFVRMQKANYELLMEKVEETKTARHDLRHHLTAIDGFLQKQEYDKLGAYVSEYRISIKQDEPIGYTRNIVADILLRHYAKIAQNQRIDFTAQAELGRDTLLSDTDLCSVISNLLENAVEACARIAEGARFISVVLIHQKAALSIYMENSASMVKLQETGGFSSIKSKDRTGYGLKSISAIAKRCGGEAEFEYDKAKGIFKSTVLFVDGKLTKP